MEDTTILERLRNSIEEWLWGTGLTTPPHSSIFFIFVTLLMSGVSNVLNRLLLDMETLQRENEILQAHNKEKKEAMANGDKKLWIKVQRREPAMQEYQQKMMMRQMLPMLISYGPIIFIFTTLRETFQHPNNLALNADTSCVDRSCGGVVVLPFGIPESFPILGKWFSPYTGDLSLSIAGYGFWYFLSAMVTSTVFRRVFGIDLSRNPNKNASIM